MIEKCRSAESTSQQLKAIGDDTAELNAVRSKQQAHARSKLKQTKSKFDADRHARKTCKFCGESHAMNKKACPAFGKKCDFCHRQNHYASVCYKKNKLHAVVESSDDEVLLAVGGREKNKTINAEMQIEGKTLSCQIDSGASVNVISARHMTCKERMEPCQTKLHIYNGDTIRA